MVEKEEDENINLINYNYMKGGVLFSSDPDIMPELRRFANGTIEKLIIKEYAVLFQLTADESTVLTSHCGVKTIILKVVPIDNSILFEGETVGSDNVKEFVNQVSVHEDIIKRSIEKWGCSIAPTLLHADIYDTAKLETTFPKIHALFPDAKVGIIFMEKITKDGVLGRDLDVASYPRARRLLIMLAEIGFAHNDHNEGNILVTDPLIGTEPALTIIDFGRTTRIPEPEIIKFKDLLERYEASKEPGLKKEILDFLHTSRYLDISFHTYPRAYQWLIRDKLSRRDKEVDTIVEIADESSIVLPIRFDESQKEKCIYTSGLQLEKVKYNNPLHYPDVKNDKDTLMVEVMKNGLALQYASDELRKDEDVIYHALKQNIKSLQYVLDEFYIMDVVGNDGMLLQYVNPKLTSNKNIVEIALEQNGNAIQFTPLKSDPEIIMIASMHGYSPTKKDIQHIIPFIHKNTPLVNKFKKKYDVQIQKEVKHKSCTVCGGKTKRTRRRHLYLTKRT